ncbi:hypothetical protein E6P09_19240 (plasmid) [Haloferax mediterranei ATCC 33500]|uniref:Uncharacterized protein n=1 Tax=Haloferax mediterranei (strain ATCC 33500 / DSM 1411 / JCM 8866 / NBRC 14739 / NCIMB 2177 / R-4) TaxID=523841 RepID=I3R957_HALMT|nr:hypothetical protein [Haloferax mediterranei]AFK20767.1 hypothetical protein HFX_4073 [Haloferax mediterranei ATCC 33500]AHZ23984.1 hypothetical protein BM92_19435 [Haloferax mediterranei ATCC 33500]ELZ97560.1 hypothetical protein C439_16628 [Haloferax mediterranei ATCC 33500]MDX5989656.1 hypothetical protein [Haloferax mediterranei ATCC 33500]QCQ77445.1 hypothetical protein E6P09_19240 [Haloferax mediterranei ATCC 33500]
MHIEDSYNDETTTLSWEYGGESVSVTLPGLFHAEYAERSDVVVTATAEGTIRILAGDGTERDAFEYTLPEGCDLYTLTPSIGGDLGVTMVVAHDPGHRGETLWQHEIDIERRAVGGPVAKWR